MTENEAKEMLAKHYEFLRESWKPYPDGKILDAIRVAISSIDKIQQYRVISAACEIKKLGKSNLTGLELAIIMVSLKRLKNYEEIGTVEECRAAVEKHKAKRPNIWGDGNDDEGNIIYDMYDCPNCGKSYEIDYSDYKYCPECGQAIDWSDYND